MKLSGSYASIARGVSQQVAQQRLDGQHEEQVNLISDPVVGLVRRRGSAYLAADNLNIAHTPSVQEYLRGLRNFDFRVDGEQYSLLFPSLPATSTNYSGVLRCYHKQDKQFLPLVAADTPALNHLRKGINKVTQVGDVLVLAVRDQPTLFTRSGDLLAADPYGTVWIKSGNYSRTYTLKITRANGAIITSSYTTPSANYPGALDTSDIPYDSPNYTKLVNDRVNAYNSAVTQWMTTAAAQVRPAYIASQLSQGLTAQGVANTTFETNHIGIHDMGLGITDISITDGGDGTGVKAVWKTVRSVADLPYGSINGKIVEVRPTDGEDRFYMKAEVANGGWGPATWVETKRVAVQPDFLFLLAVLHNGQLVVGSSPASINAATGLHLPGFSPRAVGDEDSSPVPHFFGKEVTYVGTFQDRLVVCAGSVISMSAVGDYFNFFRSSVLTVKDSDAGEVYALGADDDIIRHSVLFDKSIVFFGERQQYTVDGRVPITPRTTTVIQSSAHEDATDAAPVSRGELVFFAKRRENLTKINQIEIGDVQDTSRVTEISLQLSDYIGGVPVQLLATTNPDLLLVRSSGDFRSIVTYRYLDRGQERILDSWSRWEYPEELGDIVGMTPYEDQLVMFHAFVREGVVYLVVTGQSLLTQTSPVPYLDCHFPLMQAPAILDGDQRLAVALDNTHPEGYLAGERQCYGPGGSWPGVEKLAEDYPGVTSGAAWVGFVFNSHVTLTSPFRRDQNGVAITTGRLTINRVDVSFRDTPGLDAWVDTDAGSKHALDFNGRLLGSASSEYPLTLATASVPIFVGKESRGYRLRLCSKDWRPFTLTVIEWTGQYFYNARR